MSHIENNGKLLWPTLPSKFLVKMYRLWFKFLRCQQPVSLDIDYIFILLDLMCVLCVEWENNALTPFTRCMKSQTNQIMIQSMVIQPNENVCVCVCDYVYQYVLWVQFKFFIALVWCFYKCLKIPSTVDVFTLTME